MNTAEHVLGTIGPRTTLDKVALTNSTVTDALMQMANNNITVSNSLFEANNATAPDGAGFAKLLSGKLSLEDSKVSDSQGASVLEMLAGSSCFISGTSFVSNVADMFDKLTCYFKCTRLVRFLC